MLVIIGAIGLALACAIFLVATHARKHRERDPEGDAWHQGDEASLSTASATQRNGDEVRRQPAAREMQRHQGDAHLAAAWEAQREAEEKKLLAVGHEVQQLADEAREKAEGEARLTAEREAQRQADETRRNQAEEEARSTAKQEMQRQADDARQKAEAEARRVAEREAQQQADETRLRLAEEEARSIAKQEMQRQADEAGQKAEAEARLAAEREAQRQAEAGRTRAGPELRERSSAEPDLRGSVERQSEREVPNAAADHQMPASAVGDETVFVDAGSAIPPIPFSRKPVRHKAPQFRPPRGAPSRPTFEVAALVSDGDVQQSAATERRLIELRVLFDRGGSCRVTLLPKRGASLPEECTVATISGETLRLVALEEEWYQDVAAENLGALLRDGVVWTNSAHEWVLAGREIFVLTGKTTHRGFVTHPRLTLGREYLVLCTTTRLAEVEDALEAAGCTNRTLFREDDGAPTGWILIGDLDKAGRPRGFVPTAAVPMVEGAAILNVLRPRPELEISLEGGVPLGYGSWLAGYPPAIQVFGDPQHIQKVLIDGKQATLEDDGTFRAAGWDQPGSHQVWCSNVSRSYSLELPQTPWDAWPAYAFPSATSCGDQLAICGPLVRPLATDETLLDATGSFAASDVLQRNPILLGAIPGQVFVATTRRDLRGAVCFARPPFPPIWALPAQPLHCDKMTNRIFLVCGTANAVTPDTKARARAISQWCRHILDASRKGLPVEPAATALWGEYKRLARDLWRSSR